MRDDIDVLNFRLPLKKVNLCYEKIELVRDKDLIDVKELEKLIQDERKS